ncbi:MAG: hypothetical protein JHC93_07645, partial [Parachlamydiales bacterium]|nr:hypothetical protein [Parachlamydiales bacterium]
NTSNGGISQGGLEVKVVDLLFKDAKTEISVHLPDNINSSTPQKFPFTCRKYHQTEVEINGRRFKPLLKETTPDLLSVTIDQIRNLKVRAGIFERGRPIGPKIMDSSGKISQQQTVRRSDRDINLEVPKDMEIGQTYSLVVSSIGTSLSACFVKKDTVLRTDTTRVNEDDVKENIQKLKSLLSMGEALINEGMRNLEIATKGSSISKADVVTHIMQETIRAGQLTHPEIKLPHTKPSEGSLDLDNLSLNELQLRFNATFKKDKELECQRMQAACAGNISEINKILVTEVENTQLLMNLVEAIQKKGFEPQIP